MSMINLVLTAEGLPLKLGAAARNQFALAKSWNRQDQDCTAILPLLHYAAGSHRAPE